MAKKGKKKIDVKSIVPPPPDKKAQAPKYTGKLIIEIVDDKPTDVSTNPSNQMPIPIAIQYCEIGKVLLQRKLYDVML